MNTLDSTISRMLSDYHGDAVIEPTEEFDGDLSPAEARRFVIRALAAAGLAVGFIAVLFSALSPSTALSTGAGAQSSHAAPVPALIEGER